MGGGGGSTTYQIGAPQMAYPQIESNPYESPLFHVGQGMWQMTQPARNYIGQDWESLFNPAQGRKYDPANLPAFSPLYNMARTGLEDQYSAAKENILSSMPRGGGMARQLGNLETGRAKDVGSLLSQISAPIISDMYNKAYNAGFVTGPSQAITGMGTAAGLANTRNIAQGGLTNQRNLAQGQLDWDATKAALGMTAQSEAAARQGSSMKGAGIGSMLGKAGGSVLNGLTGGLTEGLGGLFGGGGGYGSSIPTYTSPGYTAGGYGFQNYK